jgi:hypothetical protein
MLDTTTAASPAEISQRDGEPRALGTAWRAAQAEADAIAYGLTCATGSVDERLDAVWDAARSMGFLLAHLNRSDVGDMLHFAATNCGIYRDAPVDAVQERIAKGLEAGENDALDDRAAA